MWHGLEIGGELQNYLACQLALYLLAYESVWIVWLVIVAVEMLTGGIGIGFCVG